MLLFKYHVSIYSEIMNFLKRMKAKMTNRALQFQSWVKVKFMCVFWCSSYGQIDAATPSSVLETDHLGGARDCDKHFYIWSHLMFSKNPSFTYYNAVTEPQKILLCTRSSNFYWRTRIPAFFCWSKIQNIFTLFPPSSKVQFHHPHNFHLQLIFCQPLVDSWLSKYPGLFIRFNRLGSGLPAIVYARNTPTSILLISCLATRLIFYWYIQ